MIKFILKRKVRKYSKAMLNGEILRLSKIPNKTKDLKIYNHILCAEYRRRFN